MRDCCIRVTALLDCFKLTLNKLHIMTRGMILTILSMPNGWGLTFGAISCYYAFIIQGHVPLALGIERGHVHHATSDE